MMIENAVCVYAFEKHSFFGKLRTFRSKAMTNAKSRVLKNQLMHIPSTNMLSPAGPETGLGQADNCAGFYFKPLNPTQQLQECWDPWGAQPTWFPSFPPIQMMFSFLVANKATTRFHG